MNNFEEKRQQKAERYSELAEKARAESSNAFAASDRLVEHIPPGQPILVGHHSEKRHRRTLNRAHNLMDKGVQLNQKAEYYERRAEAVLKNTAIFSDDPNATEKLADKIERLENRQTLMREANKAIRKNNTEKLLDLGFSESQIPALFKPDFCGRIGFADYQLTNNGANIRRLRQRLEQLTKLKSRETVETKFENDIRIVDNIEDNRTQIFFPEKPNEKIRKQLKGRGFRWSPTCGAWQKHLSNGARYDAEKIIEEFQK